MYWCKERAILRLQLKIIELRTNIQAVLQYIMSPYFFPEILSDSLLSLGSHKQTYLTKKHIRFAYCL